MVTAASLCDIVEKGGQIESVLLEKRLHQDTALRQFIVVLGYIHPSEIPHNEKKVCIDRVDMEEIMLHLSDDLSKSREIGTKDSISIHFSKCPRLPGPGFQNLHEQ